MTRLAPSPTRVALGLGTFPGCDTILFGAPAPVPHESARLRIWEDTPAGTSAGVRCRRISPERLSVVDGHVVPPTGHCLAVILCGEMPSRRAFLAKQAKFLPVRCP